MELCKRVILLLLPIFLIAEEVEKPKPISDAVPLEQDITGRILFYLQRGFIDQAIKTYVDSNKGAHNSEILEAIALAILKEGFNSGDPESQLMSIFGAGISLNEKMLGMLEQALSHESPDIQLASLNFLARYQNDQADNAINNALASDYLLVRLEAALHLAEKKHPKVVDQTDALMQKVPKQIHPLFPQLFAMIGTADAIKTLRKMAASPQQDVRIEAIRSIAKYGRDDLIEKVRKQATHHNPAQQEVCAHALGIMKDASSIPQLEKMSKGNTPAGRLAALYALWSLGKKETAKEIEAEAKAHNLFAINLLGNIPEGQNTLFDLTKNVNIQVKFNAALALLELQDPRCLPVVCELLIKDSKDLGITPFSSLGGTLHAFKIVPSATENFKDSPEGKEITLHLMENFLIRAVVLPEADFLKLAATIFESRQNPLIPTLVPLLEKLQTPESIKMLKTYQQKAGAPLIRNYCNLALYRLKEPGPYLDNLKKWVAQEQKNELIRFRPIAPRNSKEITSTHQLTPEETSRLLVEVFETIASMQEKESLDILLSTIQSGNKKNKYALAGLLIRAAQ